MRIPRFAVLIALASVPAARAETPFDYKGLGDTDWMAKEWSGEAPKPRLVPQIEFAPPNRFTASAGCNRHMGVYTVAAERADGTLTAHAADGAAVMRLRCTKNC